MFVIHTLRRSTHNWWLLVALVAVSGLIGLFVVTSSAQPAPSGLTNKAKPTIVLVHGAWADSSSWSKVISRLQRKGYRVIAPANPLRSLAGDSAYLASILSQEQGPFVLVGHSYGGAVISNAAAGNPDAKALVYINGFVPEVGEDILHLAGEGSLIESSIEFKQFPPGGETDVDVYIKPANFHETFAGDLSIRQAAVLAVTQRPIALAAAAAPSQSAAWKAIPSWYLLGRQDKSITPAAQRFMADRAGSTTIEVDASHLSLISRPGAVAKLIEDAARPN